MAGKHKNSKISAAGSHGGNAIKQSMGSRIFDVFNICLFILLAIVILFPFWNIIAISLTGNAEYMASSFILFPKKPTLEAYKYIFSTALFIRAFGVTFLITITGTALSVLVTSMLAYGLKKPNLHGYKFFMIYLLITMFFSGGLIPTYYNITKTLHLSNNILALILPGAVNVFNFVIMRSASGLSGGGSKNRRSKRVHDPVPHHLPAVHSDAGNHRYVRSRWSVEQLVLRTVVHA